MLRELALPFCHMDTKDQTQVIGLGGKLLDLPSHLMAHFMINVITITIRGGEVSHSVHVAVDRRQIYGVSSLLNLDIQASIASTFPC